MVFKSSSKAYSVKVSASYLPSEEQGENFTYLNLPFHF